MDDSRVLDKEEDDEFLFYNNKKPSMYKKLCSCFINNNNPIQTRDDELIKPCGLFGQKSYL